MPATGPQMTSTIVVAQTQYQHAHVTHSVSRRSRRTGCGAALATGAVCWSGVGAVFWRCSWMEAELPALRPPASAAHSGLRL